MGLFCLEKTDSMSVCHSNGCSITAEVQRGQDRIVFLCIRQWNRIVSSFLETMRIENSRFSVTISKCTPYSSFLGALILEVFFLTMWISCSFVLFKRREEKEKERNQTLQCVCARLCRFVLAQRPRVNTREKNPSTDQKIIASWWYRCTYAWASARRAVFFLRRLALTRSFGMANDTICRRYAAESALD